MNRVSDRLRRISSLLVLFLCIFFTGGSSIANAPIENVRLKPPSHVSRYTEVSEILSVLEGKVGVSPKVTQKVRDKALRLSDKQLRLIASLAEQAADGDKGAAADFVLFLMTILIIVS